MLNTMLFFKMSEKEYYDMFDTAVTGDTLDLSAKKTGGVITEDYYRLLPKYLRSHPAITKLNLQDQGPYSESMNYDRIAIKIAEVPHLRAINMTNFSIGDDAMEQLLQHPNLSQLQVGLNLRITDKSVDRLMGLSETPLKLIDLDLCSVSSEKSQALHRCFEQSSTRVVSKRRAIHSPTREQLVAVFGEDTATAVEMRQFMNKTVRFSMQAAGIGLTFVLADCIGMPKLYAGIAIGLYYASPKIYQGLVQGSEYLEEFSEWCNNLAAEQVDPDESERDRRMSIV